MYDGMYLVSIPALLTAAGPVVAEWECTPFSGDVPPQMFASRDSHALLKIPSLAVGTASALIIRI